MIYFDATRSAQAGHRSGLTRVASRLLEELGVRVIPVTWKDRGWFAAGARVRFKPEDWVISSDLFNDTERPGILDFISQRSARFAVIFHDAIPLKRPDITWPKSVARHPAYMKLLAQCDAVWPVSQASMEELLGYWKWLRVEPRAVVQPIVLGADLRPDRIQSSDTNGAGVLAVGILEPRKNQGLLLEACEGLWQRGHHFRLTLVGRVNPHFGQPIVERIHTLRQAGRDVLHLDSPDDTTLLRLYRESRLLAFPTIAEGCGLPLLEALWMGLPCVCSDLPVLRENAEAGGCVTVPVNDLLAWQDALGTLLQSPERIAALQAEAQARALPTWRQTAEEILRRTV